MTRLFGNLMSWSIWHACKQNLQVVVTKGLSDFICGNKFEFNQLACLSWSESESVFKQVWQVIDR